MDVVAEITALHDVFEGWFLGTLDTLERVDLVLHPDFTFVGADGAPTDRAGTMAALEAGRAHTASLTITTTDHRVVAETTDLVVAEYIEHHQLTSRTNARRSTVIFTKDVDAPHDLRWLRVHETWLSTDDEE